jgi:seryl-tRNA synthetase
LLDIDLIRNDFAKVEANIARRQEPRYLEMLHTLKAKDDAWRKALKDAADARRKRNELSRQLSEAKKRGEEKPELRQEAAALPAKLEELEKLENALIKERDQLLMKLPNLLDESVPYGKDDSENVMVSEWGKRSEAPKGRPSHGDFLEAAGLADFEMARKVSGAGFYYMKGSIALLDLALQRFAIDLLVQRGFVPVIPPCMLRRAPYEGVTDLSDFENVMYKIDGDDLYLIATSEHPMAALHMGEVLDEDSMPIRLAGVSPCFRKEIGGHGVDQKGIFRVHQFNKVEQFVFCRPEDSVKIHEELRGNLEDMFRLLGIPYRVVNVCTGDLGIVASKKYDVEAWYPKQAQFREVGSCSNCTDYQARRLGIRMGKPGKPGKVVPHTLNSTAIATTRAIVAILENYAKDDKTVIVPDALRPYMGGLKEMGTTQLNGNQT